jgi:predicted NBD/HSP70 family sugar kinase
VMLAVTDLGGKIISLNSVELPTDPQNVIGTILSFTRKMLRSHPDRTFEGIGINLPGRFDPHLARSIFAPNVAWPIGQLKARVERATGLPVVVDNVANACALSEVWFGYSDRMHDLVVVNVSEGIGTGIFANGHLLRGDAGVAGEFGHVQLDPNGVRCGCGGRGCWETIASNRAGLRYYSEIAKKPIPSFDALIQLAKGGDAAAKQALTMMCKALGRGMHMIALALAPSEIVVVGDITNAWDLAGAEIETEMRRFALVRAPSIRAAREGNKARLRSAVALIMNSKTL